MYLKEIYSPFSQP